MTKLLGRLLCTASAVMAAGSAFAQEGAPADNAVSEVVVTGSFIRSQSFKPSSPVDVISRKDLETRAPTSVAEFLRDLPYNVNSTVTPASRGPTASTGGGTINLRNLGEGATLVLLNSKRQTKLPREANVIDVNGLVPQIMIKNIEILKDGASSLYGSDAVGGVVNFITRDDFTGAEIRAQGNFLTYSGKQESRVGALFGGEFAKTHIVAAFEYNNRDEIYPEDQPFTQIRNLSTPWNPGRFVVPRRNAAGALTTTTTRVQDQGCGVTKQTYFFAAGQPNVTTDACYYDFWPDSAMVSKEQRYQFYTSAKHEFADWLVFKAEAGYQKAHLYGAQSTSASINVFPAITVPGYNPGVARADADRVAAGLATAYLARNASGQQLYAVPSAAGSLIPARDAAGNVVLTATPTVASSGIPFYEDTVFEGRILGSQCGLPTNNTLDAGVCARTYRQAEDINDAMHLVAGFSGDFWDGWHYETSLTYSKINEENDAQRNNVLIPQLRAALQGFGGPNCNALSPGQLPGTGNCYFFNPFNNAIYAAPGSAAANRWDVIDWLMPKVWDRYETSQLVFDAYATGPIFKGPAGPVNLAVGVQYRKDTWSVDFDAAKNTGIIETGTVSNDVSASQNAKAVFAEVAAPVFDNGLGSLNINAAVRYEKAGKGSTTDPKIGAIYSIPDGRVKLRASYGTSFLAPSLFQQFTSSSGLANINDTGPGIRGQDAVRRVTTLNTGNPDLVPQTSKTYSFGVLLNPISNLRFDVGYWHYSFDNLISQENTQALVTANNPLKVIRDAQNNVIFVKPSYVNLASLVTAGYDFEASYAHDIGRFGRLDGSWTATYTPTFDLKANPTAAVVHAAGNRNTTVTGGVSSPRWRGLGRITWSMDRHSLTTLIHYYGGINNDATVSTPGLAKQPGDWHLSGVTTFDLSYTYNLGQLWKLDRTSFTVGVQNLFQAAPETPANTAPIYVDQRGRIAYVRVVAGF